MTAMAYSVSLDRMDLANAVDTLYAQRWSDGPSLLWDSLDRQSTV